MKAEIAVRQFDSGTSLLELLDRTSWFVEHLDETWGVWDVVIRPAQDSAGTGGNWEALVYYARWEK